MGLYAVGDLISFTSNQKYYKNGDKAKITQLRLTENKFKNSIEYAKVEFTVIDETDFHTLLKCIQSRDSDDSYHIGMEMPENLVFVGKDDRDKTFTFDIETKFIKHSYCITSYKCQGSQANIVFFLVPYPSSRFDSRHYYTVCSRAREKLLLIGPRNSFDSRYALSENARPRTTTQKYFDSKWYKAGILEEVLQNDFQKQGHSVWNG